jgi:hypothetical protein
MLSPMASASISISTVSITAASAAGKGTRMADEIIQKDLDHTIERYNPVLDQKKNVNKDAEGLDCVHEMNTINHYVGMFPIATGAPVEKPMAKFFFGFFAVMLIGFAGSRAPARCRAGRRLCRRGRLDAGAPVRPWPPRKPCHALHEEAGTFFKEPDKIKVWGDNVRLVTHAVIAGLILAMAIVLAGVAKLRGFQLLLVLVPALMPIFFVLEYAGWLWFFGHNLHPWGAFTVKPFMPTVFGEGKVAQFSTFSYPYWGYGCCC